jgi:hypothetical protein
MTLFKMKYYFNGLKSGLENPYVIANYKVSYKHS